MIFRNPFKNDLYVIDMLLILVASTALAILACRNTNLMMPLVILIFIYCSSFAMFVGNKMLRILLVIVCLGIIAYLLYHDVYA